MTEMIKVKAVDGRLLPTEGVAGSFVGFVRVGVGAAHDLKIPGGQAFKRAGSALVPNSPYYRRALRRGDIALDGAKNAAKAGKGS